MSDEPSHVAYAVEFLGCKISLTDAQTIADALDAAGHVKSTSTQLEVGVVNTCCITADAEKKSRKRVSKLLAATSEDGRVFVTGCGAANGSDAYTSIDPRVTVLPGAASLAASAIAEAADTLSGLACRGPVPGVAPGHQSRQGADPIKRTRAFVKVQDGCDFHCSYCIVPAVRGEPRSRPLERILDEVHRRVATGQREIVLTGVNIGLYRDAPARVGFDKALLAVAEVAGVARVRISSIESNHVNRRLLAAMAAHPKICPHLHIPLQSGDDAVLAAMGRHYDSHRYEQVIERARAALPGLNLTTDVIVGYPTEDAAAFDRTLAFVERMGFTKVHAFPYSERPDTAAKTHADPVDRATKAERSRRVRAAADRAALDQRTARIGSHDEVLVEMRATAGYGASAGVLLTDEGPGDKRSPMVTGYTRDYHPVCFADEDHSSSMAAGDVVEVEVVAVDPDSGVLLVRRHSAATGCRSPKIG